MIVAIKKTIVCFSKLRAINQFSHAGKIIGKANTARASETNDSPRKKMKTKVKVFFFFFIFRFNFTLHKY